MRNMPTQTNLVDNLSVPLDPGKRYWTSLIGSIFDFNRVKIKKVVKVAPNKPVNFTRL